MIMKTFYLLFSLLFLAQLVFSQREYTVKYTDSSKLPLLDGYIDDAYEDADEMLVDQLHLGSSFDNSNYGTTVRMVHDGEGNIMIFGSVKDDEISSSEDFVAFGIDLGEEPAVYGWGGGEALDDNGFVFSRCNAIEPPAEGMRGVNWVVTETGQGYDFEAEIVLSNIANEEFVSAALDRGWFYFDFVVRYSDAEGDQLSIHQWFGNTNRSWQGSLSNDAGVPNVDGDTEYVCMGKVFLGSEETSKNVVERAELKIYPNPCKDHLIIDNAEYGKVSLFDISGRKVLNADKIQNTLKLDVTNLNSGMYFLTLNGKSKKVYIK